MDSVLQRQPFDISSALQAGSLLKYHLKEKLLDRLRTGDAVYDTVVGFAIIYSQEFILNYIGVIKNWLVATPGRIWYLIKYLVRRWKNTKTLVAKSATIKYITDGREINTLFEPILWFINGQTDTSNENLTDLSATKTNPVFTQQIPKHRSSSIKFMDYELTYQISNEMITIYGDREYKRENTIITLSVMIDKSRNVDIFEQFSQVCMAKYKEWTEKQKWQQLIYRNENDQWKSQHSKTKRKLKTVILKKNQLDDVVNDLDDFLHKEDWYISRDVPYTRRYMFWGTPGTGKSSLIKALASYTKRHIHYLVLSEIKSDAELFKLFEQIPFAETILVIEDIDCASKITHSRNIVEMSETKDTENDPHDRLDAQKDKEIKTTLTLSGLLNAIDGGMINNHGQIMIVTTNHPENLDDALVRPGRVDRKIEFSNCDDDQIRYLFHNFFDVMPPTEAKFVPNKSPAEITGLLLQYKKDPQDAWNQLVKAFSIN